MYTELPAQKQIERIVGCSLPTLSIVDSLTPGHLKLAERRVIGNFYEHQVARALYNGGLRPLLDRQIKIGGTTMRPTSLGGVQTTGSNEPCELDSVVLSSGCSPIYVECKSGDPGKSLRKARLKLCFDTMKLICIHTGLMHKDDDFQAGLTIVTPTRDGIGLRDFFWENGIMRLGGIINRTPLTLQQHQEAIIQLIRNRSRR